MSLHQIKEIRFYILPPRHCEFNPIEMIWSDFKGYIARNNSSYKETSVIRLFKETRSHFNAWRWATFEIHVVEKVNKNLWLVDSTRDNEFMT